MPEDLQAAERSVAPIRTGSNASSIYSSITAPSEYCAPLFSRKISSKPQSQSKHLQLPILTSKPGRRSVSTSASIKIPIEILSSPDSPWSSSDSEVSVRRWSSNASSERGQRQFLVAKKRDVSRNVESFETTQPLRIVSAGNVQKKKNLIRSNKQ